MQATQQLHRAGQSLWLDNITRDLLTSGTLAHYISELSITGLTSNPTIFDQAIKNGTAYDAGIRERMRAGNSGQDLFFEIALEDITRAADLFRPIHERTARVDGWVSLEVSPLLARDAKSTLAEARDLHARAGRPNLFIKIPGTPEGLPAIEEAIFAGVPVNVTLLFSSEQYVMAAEAWLRGIERRIEAGLNPDVGSVASLFISRWDAAVAGKVPSSLVNTLGIAVGQQSYKSYSQLVVGAVATRVQRGRQAAAAALRQYRYQGSKGVRRPLHRRTGRAPTVNTMPEKTLKAFADHGKVGEELRPDGGTSEEVLEKFTRAGVDLTALAARLQDEGAASFVASWNELLGVIASKSDALRKAG